METPWRILHWWALGEMSVWDKEHDFKLVILYQEEFDSASYNRKRQN